MAVDRLNDARKLMLALLIGAAPLAACAPRPAAPPAYEASELPPPSATELAGDPDARPPEAEPAPEPLPAENAAPPAPARGGDEVIYDLGPVTPAPAIVTMAPIPNPPESPRLERRRAAPETYTVAPRRQPAERTQRASPSRPSRPAPAPTPRSARVEAARASQRAAPAPARAPTPPAPALRSPARPEPAAAAKPAAPAARPAVPATASRPARPARALSRSERAAERSAKLAALQTALRGAVASEAALSVPRLPADRPGDVTLTLPAEFSAQLRSEAEKQGLADAAASVNLTAGLSGDGYAIVPDATQSQPLIVGQPTVFRWTVTAQPGPRSPLRADVGADLLGGGSETLTLGSVQGRERGFHLSSRALGAGLLALIAVIVLAWLARGRRTPAQAEARRRSAQRERNGLHVERPVDLNGDGHRP